MLKSDFSKTFFSSSESDFAAIFPLVTVRLPAVIAAPASMAPGSHEVMMADGASTKVSKLQVLKFTHI